MAAVGVHGVNLPGLAGLATHQDKLAAIGRPVHHEDLHGAAGELQASRSVAATAPEGVIILANPRDPVGVVRELDAPGDAEPGAVRHKDAGGAVVAEQLRLRVEANEEGATAAALDDGRTIIERAIGDANRLRGASEEAAMFRDGPDVAVAIACRLENVVAAIVGPAATAFRSRGAVPVIEQQVRASCRRCATCHSVEVWVSLLSSVTRRRPPSGDQRSQKARPGRVASLRLSDPLSRARYRDRCRWQRGCAGRRASRLRRGRGCRGCGGRYLRWSKQSRATARPRSRDDCGATAGIRRARCRRGTGRRVRRGAAECRSRRRRSSAWASTLRPFSICGK
jgi:hypothetical protein